MTIHCRKVHNYLGMDLDFSSAKTLKIGMIKYIKKIHDKFPEEINSVAATPAAEHLFTVCEDNKDKLLPEEQVVGQQYDEMPMLVLQVGACPCYLRKQWPDALQQA